MAVLFISSPFCWRVLNLLYFRMQVQKTLEYTWITNIRIRTASQRLSCKQIWVQCAARVQMNTA